MSDAREILDRMTQAALNEDVATVTSCYSADAVLVAPEGSFKGREQIAEYYEAWFEQFSELRIDVTDKGDWGNRALEEWELRCTNTGPLQMPTGETMPATGKRVTVRGVDIATVEHGAVVAHHMYYDQLELLGQLGLLPD